MHDFRWILLVNIVFLYGFSVGEDDTFIGNPPPQQTTTIRQ